MRLCCCLHHTGQEVLHADGVWSEAETKECSHRIAAEQRARLLCHCVTRKFSVRRPRGGGWRRCSATKMLEGKGIGILGGSGVAWNDFVHLGSGHGESVTINVHRTSVHHCAQSASMILALLRFALMPCAFANACSSLRDFCCSLARHSSGFSMVCLIATTSSSI